MSRKLESPVQTQMAVAVFSGAFSGEYHGAPRVEGKPGARRRIFVQTETGCVLPMELDRVDNAHTVKRRLQVALNVPTEETSLTFGDLVLKNDLSLVRNDSPLLLTRNLLHRSSSTPCLSPTGKDLQQRDRSGPIEILGDMSQLTKTKKIVKDVVKAIKSGVDPIPVRSGLGGAYYFRNCRGECIAIVKPTDEEPFAPNNPKGFVGKALGQPGLKHSVRVGETGYREVAAYLLDYGHFANVPPTALVKISHSIFNVNEGVRSPRKPDFQKPVTSKIASFQQFIHHDFDASDHGTSSFPVTAVHRIGILDIRIFNTDRHAGNLLVRKLDKVGRFGQVELIPIDHGLCLPETLEDPYFEWIHWPQASIPFLEDELEYIANLDPLKDADVLRKELPMIREACLRVLVLSTVFLKEAVSYGLCLAEIGEMMSRELHGPEEAPSELEVVCIEARKLVVERGVFSAVPEEMDDAREGPEFQFDIDCEEFDLVFTKHRNSGNLLTKLEENLEAEEEKVERGAEESLHFFRDVTMTSRNESPLVMKLSNSFKGMNFLEKHHKRQSFWGATGDGSRSFVKTPSGSRRSANEQLPGGACFVNLAEMSEEEWWLFLDCFQERLRSAFLGKKNDVAPKQRQRLGTSCRF